MQKDTEKKKSNTSKYAILIVIFLVLLYLIYVVFSNDNTVDVEEMLKHINVGEVPF